MRKCYDRSLAHPRGLQHQGLHLAEFNPIPPNLDLLISPAQIIQFSVRSPPNDIACTVHPRARSAEGISHETLSTQSRPLQIASSQSHPRYVKLTWHSHRHRL